jgi:hypothetical protein
LYLPEAVFVTRCVLGIEVVSFNCFLGLLKIISKPFTELFSIHGFIRKDDNVKQVPLCFVLMSGRTERDYRKVFQKIIEIIGGEADCCIEELVTDFERAIWRGARNTFTEKNIKIFGCSFHWCKAVYRILKKIGLVKMYRTNEHAHVILKRVMSLHLIPPEKIHKMFKYLEKSMARLFEKDNVLDGKKHDQEMVRQFFSYIRFNWIDRNVLPFEKWSVFNQHVRTNNDAKGRHNRPYRLKFFLNFYFPAT